MLRKIRNIIRNLFLQKKKFNYSPYSFSKIKIWKECPYKFKLKYITKKSVPFSKNLAMTRGSYIHYCLEHNNNGDDFKTTQVFTKEEKKKALKAVNKL